MSRRKFIFKKIVKTALLVVFWAVVAFVVVVDLSNMYQNKFNSENGLGFFGFGDAVIASDSMYPTIEKNDVIVYRKLSSGEYEEGDVVVYKTGSGSETEFIVHRIVTVDGGVYYTKGDNNEIVDLPITLEDIVGKVLFAIPDGGTLVEVIGSWQGMLLMIEFCIIVVLAYCIINQIIISKRVRKISVVTENTRLVRWIVKS